MKLLKHPFLTLPSRFLHIHSIFQVTSMRIFLVNTHHRHAKFKQRNTKKTPYVHISKLHWKQFYAYTYIQKHSYTQTDIDNCSRYMHKETNGQADAHIQYAHIRAYTICKLPRILHVIQMIAAFGLEYRRNHSNFKRHVVKCSFILTRCQFLASLMYLPYFILACIGIFYKRYANTSFNLT